MKYPWQYSGEFNKIGNYKNDLLKEILEKIESKLLAHKCHSVIIDKNKINFKSSMFNFLFTLSFLSMATRGSIAVNILNDKINISYKFYYIETFIFATSGMLFFMGPPLFSAPNLTIPQALFITLFGWTWLYMGNYVYFGYKFRRFLGNIMKDY